MESKVYRQLILSATALFLCCAPDLPARSGNGGQTDSLVRLLKASSLELMEKDGFNFRKTVDATFLHNGTYLICDTALWNVDRKAINCWGNVKLMQDETILTSERLEYLVDEDLAKFRGPLVQLRNKQENVLRTKNLDYNTRDSIALFRRGGAMKDKDGQIIESDDGTYNSSTKKFTFDHDVNMFTDSVFIRTSSLVYDGAANHADFVSYIDFWKDGNMLSAQRGWYDRNTETFFFRDSVHALTENQESWSDTLYFYRTPNDVMLLGHAQIQDTTRRVSGLANYIYYQDSIRTITMKRDAAVAMETENEGTTDTLYFGADSLVYCTVRMCDIPDEEISASKSRIEEMNVDPVMEYRRKAAEEAAKAAEEAAMKDPNRRAQMKGRNLAAAMDKADTTMQGEAVPDTVAGDAADISDTLRSEGLDSLAIARADSLALADSLANIPPPDTTKVGFLLGKGRVRIFRKDIQMRCDSLRYCDLDSIGRFYIDPVIWNEGNRQYTSDSLSVLVRGGRVDRASLMSNAFIITQEDSVCFDQIKGAEVMAYFDSTAALRRFDALGGASALFYLQENDAFSTVNKVESKMLSALMKNGQTDRIFYFEQPKNDAYPVVQLPETEKRMKGFNWQPEGRPTSPQDITSLKVRRSERAEYEKHPRARFAQTEIYFPGYMKGVYKGLEEARNRKREAQNPDSLSLASDSLSVRDSLCLSESQHQEDSPLTPALNASDGFRDSAAAVDSLSSVPSAVDSLRSVPAPADSLFSAVADSLSAGDSLSVPKIPTQKEIKALQRQKQREERIAQREARWAELDSLDAVKDAAKVRKALERKRAATRKAVLFQRRQDAKDEARVVRYMERYQKQKIRNERKQKRKPAGERPQGTQAGGDLQTPPGTGEESDGGDPLLSHDGAADDSPVLGGGSVSGA